MKRWILMSPKSSASEGNSTFYLSKDGTPMMGIDVRPSSLLRVTPTPTMMHTFNSCKCACAHPLETADASPVCGSGGESFTARPRSGSRFCAWATTACCYLAISCKPQQPSLYLRVPRSELLRGGLGRLLWRAGQHGARLLVARGDLGGRVHRHPAHNSGGRGLTSIHTLSGTSGSTERACIMAARVHALRPHAPPRTLLPRRRQQGGRVLVVL